MRKTISASYQNRKILIALHYSNIHGIRCLATYKLVEWHDSHKWITERILCTSMHRSYQPFWSCIISKCKHSIDLVIYGKQVFLLLCGHVLKNILFVELVARARKYKRSWRPQSKSQQMYELNIILYVWRLLRNVPTLSLLFSVTIFDSIRNW